MEQRVSIVTLGVADLKRSREFYERLGWHRSTSNSEGIVFFQAGGMGLALYPRRNPQMMRMFLLMAMASVEFRLPITHAIVMKLTRRSKMPKSRR
jgi:catechol 2,3-dioxygenase-like lactoylglutathione lyase family enzyme